jgi:hypothetical protein
MQSPQFTLATTNMIQASINSRTYFFTVNHITREKDNKLIYGIRLNYINYFLSKTSGISDAVQLDINKPLEPAVLEELNAVLTAVEVKYKKRQSLELINKEIFSLIIRLRNFGTNNFKLSFT